LLAELVDINDDDSLSGSLSDRARVCVCTEERRNRTVGASSGKTCPLPGVRWTSYDAESGEGEWTPPDFELFVIRKRDGARLTVLYLPARSAWTSTRSGLDTTMMKTNLCTHAFTHWAGSFRQPEACKELNLCLQIDLQ
jgi:hypothetical protein